MKKPLVLVTRVIPEAGLDLIRKNCDLVLWKKDTPPARSWIIRNCNGIAGILCLLTDTIDSAIINESGSGLKVISNYAVGYNNIDINAAFAKGIKIGNTPGVLTETTADFCFALILSAGRRILEAHEYVMQGKWKTWSPQLLLGHDISGATLGIIGMGRIGRAVARRAQGFNMKVLYYDYKLRTSLAGEYNAECCSSLEELYSKSDFISLHVPLNSSTRNIIDRRSFDLMKNTAILINTGRGELVDTEALYEALQSKKIACAALDVTAPEPLPADHKLLGLKNCLVVPHIASASIQTRNKMAVMAAENLLAGVFDRELPFEVKPSDSRD